jgi:hypothetical protein
MRIGLDKNRHRERNIVRSEHAKLWNPGQNGILVDAALHDLRLGRMDLRAQSIDWLIACKL